ncbi:MAG: tRNA (N(6)-L-threonylcarbamoyladenosine(37)-C(2))-methylthiotransferase MtaB, partial [Candidatus Omnitrophica bacterium]|nr:tRNA (N(6)-L-threonylcarbamoyladenosine(37)-C(2))-methylthiotransferase MtaB [Candidatus Omnitrophota bacterium]
MKKVKLFTLGCKVNQYETQAIREDFLKKGFKEAGNTKADIYLINTCTVTQAADRKSREYIYRSKRENPNAKIIVTGCYVENDRDSIAQIPGIDFIIANQLKDKIADIALSPQKKFFYRNQKYLDLKISGFAHHSRAFVKIQDGCDNRCSYCKVSLVRGPSRSRKLESIIQETRELVDNGYKEIVLTGICLGAYGKDLKPKIELSSVIENIENLDGEFRIRLSSIEAKDITDKLIQKLASSKKICRHLHIPFQSGDDKILKLMNRKYTARFYRELIKKVKKAVPEVAITTDIMVGFPGETKRHFKNTLEFLDEVSPSRMHIFSFSPRPGTAAYSLPHKIESKIVKQRLNLLKDLARDKSYEYRKKFLNRKLEV